MKREEILDTAKQYVTVDRAATHGGSEDSFGTIARFWSSYLDHTISEADVCAMMVLLKVARIKGNPTHIDNWIDTAGYAAIGGED
jgi:hypothetical protein